MVNFKMHFKPVNFDLNVRTVTSIVLWLDLIVCSCVSLVHLSQAQAEFCLNKSKDCSFHFHIVECLLTNVFVTLIALYGNRHKKPALFFPYIVIKVLFIITLVFLMIYRAEFTRTDSTSEFHNWLPAPIDLANGIALFIFFAFQFYAVSVMILSYKKTVEILSACRPGNKTFKSVVSIWIGDDSRTNMNMHSNDSTCIIETESR
ncbi:uncharacterized protein LOC135834599 [Planococcus citri]|uniref:uncharacterized protein LOC135834599 n=1 Tax=Planococcus citri TaxID=170843 RepID=UPI0031F8DF71